MRGIWGAAGGAHSQRRRQEKNNENYELNCLPSPRQSSQAARPAHAELPCPISESESEDQSKSLRVCHSVSVTDRRGRAAAGCLPPGLLRALISCFPVAHLPASYLCPNLSLVFVPPIEHAFSLLYFFAPGAALSVALCSCLCAASLHIGFALALNQPPNPCCFLACSICPRLLLKQASRQAYIIIVTVRNARQGRMVTGPGL